jgi:hypothetical protein
VPEPRVKGVAFRTVLRLVEKSRGPEVIARALAAMPTDVAHGVRYGEIIAAGWYPVTWYRAMWSALLASAQEEAPFVRALGRDAVDVDFGSIYRALLRVLTPKTAVSIGMRHFGQIYDTGRVRVVEPTAASVRLDFTGCTGFDHTMWVEILGSCERLTELAGGLGVQAMILAGGANGEDHCLARVQWH